MTANVVTPDNAPRDAEGLRKLSRPVRYRLAISMGLFPNDSPDEHAFVVAAEDVQVNTLMTAFAQRDGANGAPPQQPFHPPPQPQQQPQQEQAPHMTQPGQPQPGYPQQQVVTPQPLAQPGGPPVYVQPGVPAYGPPPQQQQPPQSAPPAYGPPPTQAPPGYGAPPQQPPSYGAPPQQPQPGWTPAAPPGYPQPQPAPAAPPPSYSVPAALPPMAPPSYGAPPQAQQPWAPPPAAAQPPPGYPQQAPVAYPQPPQAQPPSYAPPPQQYQPPQPQAQPASAPTTRQPSTVGDPNNDGQVNTMVVLQEVSKHLAGIGWTQSVIMNLALTIGERVLGLDRVTLAALALKQTQAGDSDKMVEAAQKGKAQ